jgi:probable phosphoglycerate mutase
MLIIARHGRTEANAAGRLQGRLDLPLDDVGRAQAAAMAATLATTSGGVGRIVTSPLVRTRQTAEAIAEATGASVEVDERWIELDYGGYDGLSLGEVPASVWSAWRNDPSFAPPGGESLLEVGARVCAAAEELATDLLAQSASASASGRDRGDAPVDPNVVVVTHVSPLKAAVTWTLGVDPVHTWRLFVATASITRIGVTAGGPVLHGFNEIAHLAELTGR